jgi:hypothetical protein
MIFSIDGSPTGPGISVGPFHTGGTGAYFTAAQLTAGTHTITASYSGDSNYAAASASLNVTISAAPYLLLWLAQPGPYAVNSSVLVDARASTLATGPIPTGSLTYSVDGAASATAPLSNGFASFSVPAFRLLTHPLSATYTGDPSYSAINQTLQAGLFTQSILFRGLANVIYTSGKTLALTARATSGLPVTYAVTGPATLSGSLLTLTGPGTVTVTASQPGDTVFTVAAPVARSFLSQ